MTNDYEAKLLHDARYQDLLKESKGGWLLKAARPASEVRRSRSMGRRLRLTLVWALMAALLIALIVTATVAALNAV
jgi:hypothetical protein